jgi:hypothetical protein
LRGGDKDFTIEYITRLGIDAKSVLQNDDIFFQNFVIFYSSKFDIQRVWADDEITALFTTLIEIDPTSAIAQIAEEYLIETITDTDVDSIRETLALASMISSQLHDEINRSARKVVIAHWKSNIQQEIYSSELFTPDQFGEIEENKGIIEDKVEELLSDYGIDFTLEEKASILDNCDLRELVDELKKDYQRDYDGDDDRRSYDKDGGEMSDEQVIDDLFDKK